MRDHWRADDVNADRDRRKEGDRGKSHRRHRSPESCGPEPATHREQKAGTGVNSSDYPVFGSKFKSRDKIWGQPRAGVRSSHRSPPRDDRAGLRDSERSWDLIGDRSSERYSRRQGSSPPSKRHRSRSVSAHQDLLRQSKRGVDRSPVSLDRTERNFHRHSARAISPYPSSPQRSSSTRHSHRTRDLQEQTSKSYVPSSGRHRSKSPTIRNARRTSPSRAWYHNHKEHSDGPPRGSNTKRRRSPHRDRGHPSSGSQRPPRRQTSRPRDRNLASRRSESDSCSEPDRTQPASRPSYSHSPSRASWRRDDNMRSTQPIQSILEDDSRQPSPPRPIPSFDADHPSSMDEDSHMRQAFPMHGMKATDMQSAPRPRRPNIDTRQSFSTSPQYMTPNSSHHGSPQSGSPFGNRGGWGGQQQHYQNQHGYAIISNILVQTLD